MGQTRFEKSFASSRDSRSTNLDGIHPSSIVYSVVLHGADAPLGSKGPMGLPPMKAYQFGFVTLASAATPKLDIVSFAALLLSTMILQRKRRPSLETLEYDITSFSPLVHRLTHDPIVRLLSS